MVYIFVQQTLGVSTYSYPRRDILYYIHIYILFFFHICMRNWTTEIYWVCWYTGPDIFTYFWIYVTHNNALKRTAETISLPVLFYLVKIQYIQNIHLYAVFSMKRTLDLNRFHKGISHISTSTQLYSIKYICAYTAYTLIDFGHFFFNIFLYFVLLFQNKNICLTWKQHLSDHNTQQNFELSLLLLYRASIMP